MLIFTEKLKEVLYDVQINGGNLIQKVFPPSKLVQKLREYIIIQLSRRDGLPTSVMFLFEDFKDGFFEEIVCNSLILLAEFGIKEAGFDIKGKGKIWNILTELVDRRLESILDERITRKDYLKNGFIHFDKAIVENLVSIWNEEEVFSEKYLLYRIAAQNFLIIWNYQTQIWNITGLGRFILEQQKPINIIRLILTVNLSFSTGKYDNVYISTNMLSELIKIDSDPSLKLSDYFNSIHPYHKTVLTRFGIIRNSVEDGEYEFTRNGRAIISEVLPSDYPMKDIVDALIEDQNKGIQFQGVNEEIELIKEYLKSDFLEPKEIKSLDNALSLYNRGDYLDAMRILFPYIEAIANKMLSEAGETQQFSGLFDKLKKLEKLSLISSDLANSLDITTTRNKVLHGQYRPQDEEYAYPNCIISLIYLRRIFDAFKKMKLNSNNNC